MLRKCYVFKYFGLMLQHVLRMICQFIIHCKYSTGHEVSGYIDYAHRLITENFEPIFRGEKKLRPKKGDLSFLEWSRFRVFKHDSPNYEV